MNTNIKIVCFVLIFFVIGYASNYANVEEKSVSPKESVNINTFTPPASKEITESELIRFLTVVKQIREVTKEQLLNKSSDNEKIRQIGLQALKEQNMSKEEFKFISDAVYSAYSEYDKQRQQLMPDMDDEGFKMMLNMNVWNVSEKDKTAMLKARAEHKTWYKGTAYAPAQNIELISRYEKEINELNNINAGQYGGIGIHDYADMF